MQTLQSKNIAPAVSNKPFFQRESDGNFFGKNADPFFKASPIQAKLTVNEPDDIYEKEADAMADKVVQRLSVPTSVAMKPVGTATPFIQQKECTHCEEDEKFQEEEKGDGEDLLKENFQKKPISGDPEPPVNKKNVQLKCAECEEEELQKEEKEEGEDLLKEKLQKKPIFESNPEPPDDEKNVQRKCAECSKEEKLQKKSGSFSLPQVSNVESRLASSQGAGAQLPATTQQQMESTFGADFSQVRIHNDSTAVDLNKDLHAQAFTHGSDIYFNAGKFNADSNAGKHLLAHELTHTLQQGESKSSVQRDPDDFNPIKYSTPELGGPSPGYIKLDDKSFVKVLDNGPGVVDKRDSKSYFETIRNVNSAISKGVTDNAIKEISNPGEDYLKYAADPNEMLVNKLGSNSLTESDDAARSLMAMGESGWKSLMLALNHSNSVIRIEAAFVLSDQIKSNRKLLMFIAGLAQNDEGMLRAAAVRILLMANYGNYYDNKSFTKRIIQKLEFIKIFFNEIPLPKDQFIHDEFLKVKGQVGYRVEITVAALKSGMMQWQNLADVAQVVEIFQTAMAVVARMISFMQIFDAREKTLHNQAVFDQIAGKTLLVGGHLAFILLSIREKDGQLVASPTTALIDVKSLFNVCEQIPKSIATASVHDLMIELYRVADQAVKVIDFLKDDKPPDWKIHLKTIKEVLGITNGIQKTLPQLSNLAWDKPLVYFDAWTQMLTQIQGMMQKVSAIGAAVYAHSLISTIDDSWQIRAKRTSEAENNKSILQNFLKNADTLIKLNIDNPDKLGKEIEKLRENPKYKTALAWAEEFAVDEAEFREIVLAITELALTLASIYVGGVAGRLAGLGLRAVATTGAVGAAVVETVGGGIVLGAETLGFVLTEKSLNQLFFGKGHWDTFLSDYAKAALLFRVLKGTGRLYEGLIASEKISVGAAKIAQFGTEVVTLTAMQKVFVEWDNLWLPPDEQKKFNVWQQLGHNALFLITIKIGMMGVGKLPPPLLAGLEKKAIANLEARSKALESKLDQFKATKLGSKEYQSLQKEIRNVLNIRKAALIEALQNGLFKGDEKEKAATIATVQAIQNRINELESIAELFQFNLQPTQLDNAFTFEGDPAKLKTVLEKRTVNGVSGKFERVGDAKNSEIYQYQLLNQPPIFLERIAKAGRPKPVPSDVAAMKGISWKQAMDGFWEAVQKQNFKYDASFVGNAETNVKISELLEDGWLPGKKLPNAVGRWLEKYYSREKPEPPKTETPSTEAVPSQEGDTKAKPSEASQSFEAQLNEILKLSPQGKIPAQLNSTVKNLRGRSVPDDKILAIIRNSFTHPGLSLADFFGALNTMAGKPGSVLGKSAFDLLINGLAGESTFTNARFLMERASLNQAPQVRDILATLTIDDVASLRGKFSGGSGKDFTNAIAILARGVEGTRDDIFQLLNESGKGQIALNNLTEALLRLGTGKFTPEKIRESLSFGQRLEKAFADPSQTEPLVRAIFEDAYTGKDKDTSKFKVKDGINKTGYLPVAFIKTRLAGIIKNLLNGGQKGTSIDDTRWGVVRKIIENTDLSDIQKNGMIGKIWAETNIQMERNINGDKNVQDEVSMRWLEDNGEWSKDSGRVDAVVREGADLKYKEYKSSATAEMSEAQEKIYDLLRQGEKGLQKLKPFGDNAETIFGGKDMPLFKPGKVDVVRPKDK